MPRRFLVWVLLLALALPALPQPPLSREQELDNLRGAIAKLEARAREARKLQSGLRGELDAADLELRLQEARLAEAEAARDLAVRRAEEGEREVERLENALLQARAGLRRRLGALYRLGRQGYLRFFLALRPDERLLPSIRLARYLARRDRAAVDRYQESRQRLARERDRLAAQREELDLWLAQEEARRRQLALVRQRKAALLVRAEQEGKALAREASTLVDRERKLSNLVDFLYGRATSELSGTPIQQFRGVLDWPVAGKVTERFGFRLDPRYKTRVPHNGIGLSTEAASEVRAVFPGKVLYAAPFQGYGATAIVHHPGRVFTLYAGLSELRVGAGGMVSLGDVVGLASDRLYFEIRVENRPDDPLHWLR
ncbi:MAG TPA: peptidoglycan DD-metalloendopeptidase family protein [Thermoanaerobaculia bacterium]|nr:peptidoglycan DD-metalloendopeptidase family protein [Thermoanaerobaculia bacterium]